MPPHCQECSPRSHFPSNARGRLDVCGAHLPADAAEAAAPQSPVDARLPDLRQVITVEEEVVPFFPALGRSRGVMGFSTKNSSMVFNLVYHPAVN